MLTEVHIQSCNRIQALVDAHRSLLTEYAPTSRVGHPAAGPDPSRLLAEVLCGGVTTEEVEVRLREADQFVQRLRCLDGAERGDAARLADVEHALVSFCDHSGLGALLLMRLLQARAAYEGAVEDLGAWLRAMLVATGRRPVDEFELRILEDAHALEVQWCRAHAEAATAEDFAARTHRIQAMRQADQDGLDAIATIEHHPARLCASDGRRRMAVAARRRQLLAHVGFRAAELEHVCRGGHYSAEQRRRASATAQAVLQWVGAICEQEVPTRMWARDAPMAAVLPPSLDVLSRTTSEELNDQLARLHAAQRSLSDSAALVPARLELEAVLDYIRSACVHPELSKALNVSRLRALVADTEAWMRSAADDGGEAPPYGDVTDILRDEAHRCGLSVLAQRVASKYAAALTTLPPLTTAPAMSTDGRPSSSVSAAEAVARGANAHAAASEAARTHRTAQAACDMREAIQLLRVHARIARLQTDFVKVRVQPLQDRLDCIIEDLEGPDADTCATARHAAAEEVFGSLSAAVADVLAEARRLGIDVPSPCFVLSIV